MAKVVTGKVRFSYVHVFKTTSFGGEGDGKYSVSLLIDKDDKATLKKIRDAIEAAIQEGDGGKWKKRPKNMWNPLRDGDEEREDDPNYANKYFVNAKSDKKPGVVDADLVEILDPDELYSGCYGRASISFYPFNTNGNAGVGCGLNNLQKLADGERLGSNRTSAEDDFGEDFEDEEDF